MTWSDVRSPDESFFDTLLVLSLTEGDERLLVRPPETVRNASTLLQKPLRLDRGDEGR
ncbi:MAG: hypothetical protein RL199_283 [Pseudomonadota bacterium]|jgi:hypothetical protein